MCDKCTRHLWLKCSPEHSKRQHKLTCMHACIHTDIHTYIGADIDTHVHPQREISCMLVICMYVCISFTFACCIMIYLKSKVAFVCIIMNIHTNLQYFYDHNVLHIGCVLTCSCQENEFINPGRLFEGKSGKDVAKPTFGMNGKKLPSSEKVTPSTSHRFLLGDIC